MTEERNCGTCKFSSFNNGTGKGCGSFGVYYDCDRYSKWQPIQKAPSFQMTEEEAGEIIKHVCIRASVNYKWIEIVDVDTTISELRKAGLIRKSELVELVDEAEWMYENYRSEDYCITIVEALEKNHDALQALKKDHPEVRNERA